MDFRATLAVITGGASGLGKALAVRVIAGGGKAAILDLQDALGTAVAEEIGASFFKCDVAVEAQVIAAMEAARTALGGINLLVNCAGIVGAGRLVGKEGPMSGEYFEKVVRINLIGTFLIDKAAAAIVQGNTPNAEGERGVIIHTASVAAFEGSKGRSARSPIPPPRPALPA
jgi:NAD(P)-dependent dehydrogenase (short-subunit alcohol dehydrogenase family)